MKQRCLIIMFCVILFTGCMSANPITANSDDVKSSVSLKEDDDTNLIMKYGSKFLQMHSGDNTLRAGAEEGEESLETKVFYSIEYGAV